MDSTWERDEVPSMGFNADHKTPFPIVLGADSAATAPDNKARDVVCRSVRDRDDDGDMESGEHGDGDGSADGLCACCARPRGEVRMRRNEWLGGRGDAWGVPGVSERAGIRSR